MLGEEGCKCLISCLPYWYCLLLETLNRIKWQHFNVSADVSKCKCSLSFILNLSLGSELFLFVGWGCGVAVVVVLMCKSILFGSLNICPGAGSAKYRTCSFCVRSCEMIM